MPGSRGFVGRLALLAVYGLTAAALVAGCEPPAHTTSSARMPHLAIGTETGPGPREWQITIAATGSGRAVGVVVLKLPDGQWSRRNWFFLGNGEGATDDEQDLARGTYGYAVYAAPTRKTTGWAVIPDRALVPRNVVDSGSFTIS